MELAPSRLQLRLVAVGYAAFVALSVLLIVRRYSQYVQYPQDAASASGMWAGGDLILELFIAFLFLMPTIALVFVIRNSESFYTIYAKALLGLSVTAPLSVGISFIPIFNQWWWGEITSFRSVAIPGVIGLLIFSRSLSNFARPRRLISYALLIEGLTLVGIVASFIVAMIRHS